MARTGAAILVLLANPLLAGQPADVGGWRSARWGMSKEETIAAFRGETLTPRQESLDTPQGQKTLESLRIDGVKIGGSILTADLYFGGETGGLSEINLEGAKFDFDQIMSVLVGAYGEPSNRVRKAHVFDSQWEFPSSVVRLVEATFGLDQELYINYHARGNGAQGPSILDLNADLQKALEPGVKTESLAAGYSVAVVDTVPKAGTHLSQGDQVDLKVTVRYTLASADRATISLAFQDEHSKTIRPVLADSKVSSVEVTKGAGTATLDQVFQVPGGSRTIQVCVPIYPLGYRRVFDVPCVSYPVRK